MENIIIRKAKKEEFEAVRQFYHAVTDDLRSYDYDIGWEKEVYPHQSFYLLLSLTVSCSLTWSMMKLWRLWW